MKLLENLDTELEPLYVVHDVPIYCHNHPTQPDVFNAALKALKDILINLEWPEISGHQILSLAVKNVADNAGAISIDVSVLENPVTLGTIKLRDNAGAFEFSPDGGTTWQPVGASVESTDAVPEGATNLYYTNERVSANMHVAAATAHLQDPEAHQKTLCAGYVVKSIFPSNFVALGDGAYKIDVDHNVVLNRGAKTHAQIDSFLAMTINDVQFLPFTIPNGVGRYFLRPINDGVITLPLASASPDAEIYVYAYGNPLTIQTQGTDLLWELEVASYSLACLYSGDYWHFKAMPLHNRWVLLDRIDTAEFIRVVYYNSVITDLISRVEALEAV